MPQIYLRGQGKVYAVERNASGNMATQKWLGNVPELKISLETETKDHVESYTGNSVQDATLTTRTKASMTAKLENFDLDTLALGLYGTKATITGASVTGEVLPSALVVGDQVVTANPKVSAVVVKDSAGAPATLTLNTHYKIVDADFGRIEILSIGTFVQPFKIDYTYAGRIQTGVFTTTAPTKWMRFEGLNMANSGKKVIVDLYKVTLRPLSELSMITEDFGSYDLVGSVLLDDTKSAQDALGQFGRMLDLA